MEDDDEKSIRVALIGPEQVGAASLGEAPAPTFSALDPPVLEMANGPALQAGAHFGLPGSIPGWGKPPSREQ
jgi:hypothetical protein